MSCVQGIGQLCAFRAKTHPTPDDAPLAISSLGQIAHSVRAFAPFVRIEATRWRGARRPLADQWPTVADTRAHFWYATPVGSHPDQSLNLRHAIYRPVE
jgi:hypothetical protein